LEIHSGVGSKPGAAAARVKTFSNKLVAVRKKEGEAPRRPCLPGSRRKFSMKSELMFWFLRNGVIGLDSYGTLPLFCKEPKARKGKFPTKFLSYKIPLVIP
jgi:hypothetical protein